MYHIKVINPGKDYDLAIERIPIPKPKKGEILIKVKAAGVNRADLLQAEGLYPPPQGAPDILGLEASGEVVALGDEVKGFKEGDRVTALLSGGGYAEYVTVPVAQVLPIPKGSSFAEAAAIPEAFFTCYATLFDIAKLRSNELVLIHGGASGIGTTAIQLAKWRGAKIFVTAGSDKKCQVCLNIGADHAINYNREDFLEYIKEKTAGHGVNVVLDMLGGEYLDKNLRVLAIRGRLVSIALLQGKMATINMASLLMKNLTIKGFTLRSRSLKKKAWLRDALYELIWPEIEKGKIDPIIDSIFPFKEVKKAHQLMLSREHIGKIVLNF